MTTPSRRASTESLAARPARPQVLLSVAELCALTGLSQRRLVRLLRLGVVELSAPGTAQFTAATALRLKRMLRLQKELGVGPVGAAIIVDLLDRIADLEAREVGSRYRSP
jgi:hypothetical protein